MEAVYLNNEDLNKYKSIGKGTEAKVYKVNNEYLYKIYTIPLRANKNDVDNNDYQIDNDGVKVVTDIKKTSVKNVDPYPYYIDASGVKKVYSEKVIYDAMERQKNIKGTYLPQAPIYVDGKFKGCVLKNHNHYINMHSMFLLPKKTKLQILSKLLVKVKELTDNNIYHCDLCNYKTDEYTHSNVLINPLTLNTEIIDVDGKSTVYSKTYNDILYNRTYLNFNLLTIKYLYDIDFSKELSNEDIDSLIEHLIDLTHLDYKTVYDILDYTYTTYEKNDELLRKLKRN